MFDHFWAYASWSDSLFLNICIRTSLVKPPARWELQQLVVLVDQIPVMIGWVLHFCWLNPRFHECSGGWAWHFLLSGPPSFFHPPNCWSEVQSLKNMGKYHDRGFVLKKATPFHPLVDDYFFLWKLPLLRSIPHFHKHPNSYVMVCVGYFHLNPMKFMAKISRSTAIKTSASHWEIEGHLVAATSAPVSRPRAARPECTRMYAYIYIHLCIYIYIDTDTHTDAHIYNYIYMWLYNYIWNEIYIYIYMCVSMYIYIYI